MKNYASVLREAEPPSRNGTGREMPKSYQGIWDRAKLILPHREDLIVAGREVKGGIVLHPIIATAILGAIVGFGTLMYRNFSAELAWQHDQLITLSVQKAEADKRAAEKAEELSKRLQNMDAVQIVLGRDIAKLQESQKAQKERN